MDKIRYMVPGCLFGLGIFSGVLGLYCERKGVGNPKIAYVAGMEFITMGLVTMHMSYLEEDLKYERP